MKLKFLKIANFKMGISVVSLFITLSLISTTALAQILDNVAPIADANGPFTVIDPNTGEPYPFGFYIEFEGTEVIFDGTGSYDPDGTIENYIWYFIGTGGPPWPVQFWLPGVQPSKTWDDPYQSVINLWVWDNDGAAGQDIAYVVILDVPLDIKPGSNDNSINLNSRGVIPVALLNENYFDPTTVDPTTVTFGSSGTEAQPVHWAYEDLDDDQDIDLILHFKTQEAGFQIGDTMGTLIAYLYGGRRIHAEDYINLVPPN